MPDDRSIPVLDTPEERVEIHRLSRDDFHRLVGAGVIDEGDRVELLDGVIIDLPTQYPAHSTACELAIAAFSGLASGQHLRSQKPIALDDYSEPEPDIAIVAGDVRDFRDRHPSPEVVRLLIEVSDSTLSKDRGRKLRAYARNGIPDYWVVNLVDRQVEVYRNPMGEDYLERRILFVGDAVIASGVDGRVIRVDDLLP